MSVLPPDAHAELAQLLSALQSPDNNVRAQAEDHLTNNWTSAKPEMLLMGLVEHIHGSNDATVRIASTGHAVSVDACLRILINAIDTILCLCYLPQDSFEITQIRQQQHNRAVPRPAQRTSTCYQVKIIGSFRCREGKFRKEQDWRCSG